MTQKKPGNAVFIAFVFLGEDFHPQGLALLPL